MALFSGLRAGIAVFVLVAALPLAACTTVPETGPVPALTFEQMEPVPVRVAALEVENQFNPATDINDVTSQFPVKPIDALRRYAERRIKPAGASGTLRFVIEDAHVYSHEEDTDNKLTKWTKLDRSDVYEITLRLRLYVAYADGGESNNSILNLNRSVSIPQRFSLEEKDQEKIHAVESLMDDVDRAVTDALIGKLNIAGY